MHNYNIDSEVVILSALFSSDENFDKIINRLEENDFYDQKNRKIFQIISSYYKQNQKLDHFRLSQIVEEMNLATMITRDYLEEILNAFSFTYDLDNQLELIINLSAKRQIEELVDIAKKELNTDKLLEPTKVIEMFKRKFDIIESNTNEENNANIFTVINEIEQEVELISNSDHATTGIQTHLTDLDLKTSGLQKGDLIILAARPSMGKTAMSLTLMNNMINDNKKAMIFSLEMSAASLLKRMISMDSLIPLERIRNGEFDSNHWVSFKSTLDKMRKWEDSKNLIINEKPGITVEEIYANAKKVHKKYGLDIIFVDYLQLATTKSNSESRTNEVSEISRKLKEIARELNVPVVALSQLSRAVEQRTNKRPMLSDLRESGAIEQDADVILFLYRDKYYNKASDDETTEIIIGKQRNGPTDTVHVVFQPDRTCFVDKVYFSE